MGLVIRALRVIKFGAVVEEAAEGVTEVRVKRFGAEVVAAAVVVAVVVEGAPVGVIDVRVKRFGAVVVQGPPEVDVRQGPNTMQFPGPPVVICEAEVVLEVLVDEEDVVEAVLEVEPLVDAVEALVDVVEAVLEVDPLVDVVEALVDALVDAIVLVDVVDAVLVVTV